ncbi:MAG: Na+/H+ antiporter subunit E [Myxococcota bacterium]
MVRTVITAMVLALVWVLWSWHFEPLIIGFGVAAVLLTVLTASRLKVLDEEGEPFEINLRLLGYLPWLAVQVLKANLQVAKLILSPDLPLRPHLIRVPANQRTVLGQTIHANTITITPGTISLDLRDDVILVHALDASFADEDDSGKNDQMVCWLEGSAKKGQK